MAKRKSRPELIVFGFVLAIASLGIAFFNVISDYFREIGSTKALLYSLLAVVLLGIIGNYKGKTIWKKIKKSLFG